MVRAELCPVCNVTDSETIWKCPINQTFLLPFNELYLDFWSLKRWSDPRPYTLIYLFNGLDL